jgi:transposase
VDGRGVPLSLVARGANVGDRDLLPATLDRVVGRRPKPGSKQPQNLCGDAGYRGRPAWNAARSRRFRPHIKQPKEEAEAKRKQPGWKARRWVVERIHSWLNRYRKLLVSFEKTGASYIALLSLAAALICWRQTVAICG